MKTLFQKSKAALTPSERAQIWARVSSPRKAGIAPWSWRLVPAAGLLAAGVVALLVVLNQDEEMYLRRAVEPPSEATVSSPGGPQSREADQSAGKSGSAAEVAEGQATTAPPATEATPPADPAMMLYSELRAPEQLAGDREHELPQSSERPPQGSNSVDGGPAPSSPVPLPDPGATSTAQLPSGEIGDMGGLKAGVVARGGELHYRGGRAPEANYQVDGVPVRDPLVGGGAPQVQGGLEKKHGESKTEMTASTDFNPFAPRNAPLPDVEVLRSGPPPAAARVTVTPTSPGGVPVIPNTGGSVLPNDEPYDAMYFDHAGVNPFITTEEDRLSTFAVDVDNASYTVARRYLELGNLPPADAVRVEEFVNFFPQGYPSFDGPDFRVFTEGAPSPFGDGYHLLRIGLKARDVEERDRRPAVLTFVIDVSGSMAREDRLGLVQRSLRMLVDRLRPGDVVGIVAYGSDAREVLRPTRIDDPSNRRYVDARGFRHDDVRRPDPRDLELDARWRILDAVDLLQSGGSTNAEAGLRLGYRMARDAFRSGASNRIILCSDGVANEGRTSAESILDEVRRRADEGIALTAIGVGMGNYNDVLLENLADRGDGNYFYVDDLGEARRVFIENLTGTLETVAREVKVQVEFDPAKVTRYRLLGFENRDVADRDFRNDQVDAGEVGAGHEVTALYEVKLADEDSRGTLATVRLRWFPVERREGDRRFSDRAVEIAEPFEARDLRARLRDASPHFQLDAAVAEFAEILRKSYWAKESRFEEVRRIAEPAARELGSDAAREFVHLVERAAEIQAREERGGSWERDEERGR